MIWLFDCDNLDLEFRLSNNLTNYLGLINCLKGLKTISINHNLLRNILWKKKITTSKYM